MFKVLFFCICWLCSDVAMSAEPIQTNHADIHASHIRVLAASCAACHGTQGNSVGITPTLAGLDQGYFVTQMLAFKRGERSPTVMHHHAKGLTEDEIQSLAIYFAAQARLSRTAPQTEQLKASHGH